MRDAAGWSTARGPDHDHDSACTRHLLPTQLHHPSLSGRTSPLSTRNSTNHPEPPPNQRTNPPPTTPHHTPRLAPAVLGPDGPREFETLRDAQHQRSRTAHSHPQDQRSIARLRGTFQACGLAREEDGGDEPLPGWREGHSHEMLGWMDGRMDGRTNEETFSWIIILALGVCNIRSAESVIFQVLVFLGYGGVLDTWVGFVAFSIAGSITGAGSIFVFDWNGEWCFLHFQGLSVSLGGRKRRAVRREHMHYCI